MVKMHFGSPPPVKENRHLVEYPNPRIKILFREALEVTEYLLKVFSENRFISGSKRPYTAFEVAALVREYLSSSVEDSLGLIPEGEGRSNNELKLRTFSGLLKKNIKEIEKMSPKESAELLIKIKGELAKVK